MKRLATAIVAVAASCFAEPRIVDEAAFPRIGALVPRTASDPKDDQWMIGCEEENQGLSPVFLERPPTGRA